MTTAADGVHVGDVGTRIVITLMRANGSPLGVSSATALSLTFKKPGGGRLAVTATKVTDGTNGQIEYVTKSGDVDEAGQWTVQAVIEFSAGLWHSDLGRFPVYGNL
jgi:hypothetical protein